MIRWFSTLAAALLLTACDSSASGPADPRPAGKAPATEVSSNDAALATAVDTEPSAEELRAREVAAGIRAMQQRGCIHCHEHDPADAPLLGAKMAPRLSGLGKRANPDFLRHLAVSPFAAVPSGSMPDLLRGLTADERSSAAYSLQHTLLQDSPPFVRTPTDFAAAERGEVLYHQVGCVSCHDPQDGSTESGPIPGSHRFPDLVQKYSHAGLAALLRDPLAIRPSGSMPSLQLSDREASDIAHYLHRGKHLVGTLRYELERGHRRDFGDTQRVRRERTGLADGFNLDVPHPGGDYTLTFDGFLTVESAGDFTFYLDVDDRGQLFIDDELVVDLDDRKKGAKQGQGTVTLSSGSHAIRLRYFQWVDDAALTLEYEGPGAPRGPISGDHLTSHSDNMIVFKESLPWTTGHSAATGDPQLFAKLGCAQCHDDVSVDTAYRTVKTIRELNPTAGCLADAPPDNAPYYKLDPETRTSMRAALTAVQAGELKTPTPGQRIDHTLRTLNCLACHDRDGNGGVTGPRRLFFATHDEDLGDEAKIPPSLSDVGDKLSEDWLRRVIVDGAMQRPYMTTRMPRFGRDNVDHLVADFIAVDQPKALPTPTDSPTVLHEAGRELVDTRGLQCIGCHQFNRNPSVGMQALDLMPMPHRLRREWFHRFLRNPTALKASTLMPDVFPHGKSLAPDILDGDVTRQIDAIWTYLAQGRKAVPPKGLSQQSAELIVGGRTVLYRGKLWEAGWRGIAVGYPEQLNIAFDAEELRLSLLWKGRFLNARAHWNSQGMGRIHPLGHSTVVQRHGPAIAELPAADALWPEDEGRQSEDRFDGYTFDKERRPTFRYRVGGVTVSDYFQDVPATEGGDAAHLKRTLHFSGPSTSAHTFMRLWVGQSVQETDAGYQCDDQLLVRVAGGQIRESRGEQELLVPVPLFDGEVDVTVDYFWGKRP